MIYVLRLHKGKAAKGKKKVRGVVWNLKDVNKLTYFNNIYLVIIIFITIFAVSR